MQTMFSGIVEETAIVTRVEKERDNVHISLSCSFIDELRVDQSISHDGVCLTVVRLGEGEYTVTAIRESYRRAGMEGGSPAEKPGLLVTPGIGAKLAKETS